MTLHITERFGPLTPNHRYLHKSSRREFLCEMQIESCFSRGRCEHPFTS
jgi:hypothetical protein